MTTIHIGLGSRELDEVGLLVHPPPAIRDLEDDLHRYYTWLRDLHEEEAVWAQAGADDRGDVIKAIQNLLHAGLADAHLW